MARHLGEEKVFFLGHLHGGFVALQFALDHPESLAGIIVYDSMAFNGPELGEEAGRRGRRVRRRAQCRVSSQRTDPGTTGRRPYVEWSEAGPAQRSR
ncbi:MULTISPECIES: alpha/beta fold hydrolase [Kribbella]|uniref:alpha/beta fold hydrolase n=1 Tax=Kribbella TaxID=182639 RepID=UPI00104AA89D|nr:MULTISPECIES: alpha/beta hydrolase [Kribbella]